MLEVVVTLHFIGITHGDIKDDNWILNIKNNDTIINNYVPNMKICIIDFGLGKVVNYEGKNRLFFFFFYLPYFS